MVDASQQKLDALQARIIADNVCPELRVQATQLVMGQGNPQANIVLVGEAPGKAEDTHGVPFVGASGRFLNEMLAAVGMERDDVYITNIVKYRPPNNRDPSPAEKAAFWPYLLQQLAIIQPKIIVTLGRHSGSAFIPELQLTRDHGRLKVARVDGYKASGERKSTQSEDAASLLVVPLYHPAAALYNGSLRQTLIDDFCTLAHLSISVDAA